MQKLSSELKFWLQTQFQNIIQVTLQLSQKPSPQQTPYQNKYEAINMLKKCLENKPENPYKFILYSILGQIYSDVEQNSDSLRSYQNVLKQLSKLNLNESNNFLHYYIISYNMIGLSFINRQQLQSGIGCLCKSVDIYQAITQKPGFNCYHNRSYPNNKRIFRFYYQGGHDYQQIQDSHTLTLFYLAQAYTKIGLKDKAAQYCGMTLQRQHQNNKYELKQFCNNLVGLSQYYGGNKAFAQAQYILLLALKVLPEGRKKKLRASIQISLGSLLADMLEFSADRIRTQVFQESQNQLVSKKYLIFKQFDQKFLELSLPKDLEGCQSLFRKANTQLKKALQIFVLDGYVTQHIDILFLQSKLYKSLSTIQKSRVRVFSMLEKRKQILEPLLTQLNPKAYPATWQKILVQVSQIYNDLFNIKYIIVIDVKNGPTEQKLKQLTNIGNKSVTYYKQIIKVLEEDKDAERNEQYFRSIINSKFNISKALSKFLSLDKKLRVEYLKQSYQSYKILLDYIQKNQQLKNFRKEFQKQVQLTKDMINMMPNKIDKINYGLASPLQ